jgi:glutathione S-transferase
VLTFYHSPISPNSRRVWIALLEKGVEFELVEIKLDKGEQFQPDFVAINPFQKVPVVVDNGLNLVESLAILDYLEVKYPTPAMLPKQAKDIAVVRMVQMVTGNELLPAIAPLIPQMLDFPGGEAETIAQAKQKVATVLKFLENLLDNRPYFGSENLTLAEVVAGTIVPWLARAISLSEYPKLNAWCDRITARPAWQTTATPEIVAAMRSHMQAIMGQYQSQS